MSDNSNDTQKHVVRLAVRSMLDERVIDGLCRVYHDKRANVNARSLHAGKYRGLVEKIVEKGPRGGRHVFHTLTKKGRELVARIHDETEGCTDDGEYILTVDKLPEGVNDGDACTPYGDVIGKGVNIYGFPVRETTVGLVVAPVLDEQHEAEQDARVDALRTDAALARGVRDGKLVVSDWTSHTFPCSCCKRIARASADAIVGMRKGTGNTDYSDAEIVAGFDYCLSCVTGAHVDGEHVDATEDAR